MPQPRRLAVAVIWLTMAAGAARGDPVACDIPAQPAAQALLALAKQAGVEVLFSFDELNQANANAVQGCCEPDEAIARLLRGTGFAAERDAAGRFVIVRERARAGMGDVRGCVVNDVTGEAVAGAWVRLDGVAWAVRTRVDGWFLLPEVPAGKRTIVVEAAGFAPRRIGAVEVWRGRRSEVGFVRLDPGEPTEELERLVVKASDFNGVGFPLLLDQVVVTPSRFALDEERGPIAATLTESDLLALPQLGEDLYRAISHLPGLAADDLTARFWVRGAPHEQVLARLDGVELIEPFHMKDTSGSLAILDLETVRSLDLYTGGFGAEFGGHAAGVLTMETDRHFRAEPRTSLSLSLTGARAASRGMTANGRNRWLLSARTGYPQVALELGNADRESEVVPRYYDVLAKWETMLTPEHTLAVHALHAGDRMHFLDDDGTDLRSRYGSDYVWARWQGEFGPWRGEAVVSHARVTWRRSGSGVVNHRYPLEMEDRRTLRQTTLRQDWTRNFSERALVRGGFELAAGDAAYRYRSRRAAPVVRDGELITEPRVIDIETEPEGPTWGGYAAARLQLRRGLTVEPGLRYDANDYAGDSDFGPRLNAAWSHGATTVRLGWGHYHQSQGLHRLDVLDGDATFRRSERAGHRVLSAERRFAGKVNLRIEAYERRVARPQPHWENIVETMDAVPEHDYDRVRLDPVSQQARGVELIVERRGGRLAWSASYGLARAEETLRGGVTVPRARDQRHTLYLDATYTPNPRWQFSIAWQYHSGWPTTGRTFEQMELRSGTAIIGHLGVPYDLRLPVYQRLDVRAQRRFELKHGTLRLYADVFNALNRENVFSYEYDVAPGPNGVPDVRRHTGDTLIPLLPSVGLTWEF